MHTDKNRLNTLFNQLFFCFIGVYLCPSVEKVKVLNEIM